MRRLFIVLILFSAGFASAQTNKPSIDSGVLGKWPSIAYSTISPHGRYVGYLVEHSPLDSKTFTIQSTKTNWKRDYIGVGNCYFSGNDRQAMFQRSDSLYFEQLGTDEPATAIKITSYQYPQTEAGEWLAYQQKSGELILLNLITGKHQVFKDVKSYGFNQRGTVFIITASKGTDKASIVQYLDLKAGKLQTIWNGQRDEIPGDFKFDTQGKNLVFAVFQKLNNRESRSFWYFNSKTSKAVLRIKDGDNRIERGLQLTGSAELSANGRWIFFTLLRPVMADNRKPKTGAVMVDVWSYKDRRLQPNQQTRGYLTVPNDFSAAIDINGENYHQLESESERLFNFSPAQITGDEVVLSESDLSSHAGPLSDFYNEKSIYYVVSLLDGSRKLLVKNAPNYLENLSFSPSGKYIVFYNQDQWNYFCYDIASGSLHNLTSKLPTAFYKDFSADTGHHAVDLIAGWKKDDKGVFIYDNYDLWQLDPCGLNPAINTTGGYGLTHQVKLRLVNEGEKFGSNSVFATGDTLLFTGFNITNKYNGFFRQYLGEDREPRLLTMGPYTYYRTASQKPHSYSFYDGRSPQKAALADRYLVTRCSAQEAPNYFVTTDFKTFLPISHIAPQKNYNWLTTELVTWKMLDGQMSQGVLYKPENFDPHKRYPVIFNYYEQLSHRLYEFPMPEWTTGNIDIPWFVSQGYLVFTPDIHYQTASISGKSVCEWAYNSVVSAAQCLATLPYVDGRRMAIDGHSFGGGETNYIVTHTGLFAAAAEAAGDSDPISAYLTLTPFSNPDIEDGEKQNGSEAGQGRIGASLWERPDLYRNESAVLSADKATTPLLIMHNKEDGAIQWRQSVELYMALRRNGKRVWMLQYDGQNHNLDENSKEAKDYTIRLTQFFNYYLKGSPPPKWMTEGVPAKLKGIETRLELDDSGKTP